MGIDFGALDLFDPVGKLFENLGGPVGGAAGFLHDPMNITDHPERLPFIGGLFPDPAEKAKLEAMKQAQDAYQAYRPQAEQARLEALRRVLGAFGPTNQMVQAMTGFGPPQISTEALFGMPAPPMGPAAPPMGGGGGAMPQPGPDLVSTMMRNNALRGSANQPPPATTNDLVSVMQRNSAGRGMR